MNVGEWLDGIGLDSATAWATALATLLALLGAGWSLWLQAWGRRTVSFWLHNEAAKWPEDAMGAQQVGAETAEVRCVLSNVGDTTALRVVIRHRGGKLLEDLGFHRALPELDVVPIVESGQSVKVWLQVPTNTWESETLEVSWRQAPTWRKKTRRQTIPLGRIVSMPDA